MTKPNSRENKNYVILYQKIEETQLSMKTLEKYNLQIIESNTKMRKIKLFNIIFLEATPQHLNESKNKIITQLVTK